MNNYIFSIFDLLPYLIMVILLLNLQNNKNKQRKYTFFCFLSMFIFASLRYGIGYDYLGYMKTILHETEERMLDRFEPLSRLVADIAYYTHFQIFFVITSFLTLYPIYRASLRLSINPTYSMLVFFLFPILFLEDMSIVRNAVAYSMVLWAYCALNEGKRIQSVIWIIIGYMFHQSALVGFLIYPIYYFFNRRMMHVLLYVSSFVISSLVMAAVSRLVGYIEILSLIEHYAETNRTGGGTITIILNAVAVFHLLYWDKIAKNSEGIARFLSLYNLGIVLWNIFLSIDSTMSLRFGSYFMLYIIFIAPHYKYTFSISSSRFVGKMVTLFFLLLFVSNFFIVISSYLKRPEQMSILPYQTIFYYEKYTNYQ